MSGRCKERVVILGEMFSSHTTSLDDLREAGWTIEHQTYHWYFWHAETRTIQAVPFWICELLNQAERSGADTARWTIKQALEGDVPPFGSVIPYMPVKDETK